MHRGCLAGAALIIVLGTAPVARSAEGLSVQFNQDVLKSRGLDPRLAEYFSQAPRFREGVQSVSLSVNGVAKGQVQVAFNAEGELCFTPSLPERGGFRAADHVESTGDSGCELFARYFPGAVVQADPSQEHISLLLPTDALVPDRPVRRSFLNGGTAGLFNYDALLLGSRFAGQSSQFRNLNAELGLNAADWSFRSRQVYSEFAGENRLEHLYAYASHTSERYQANLQLGQLNMVSPLFSGEAFNGFQVQPELALMALDDDSSGARVEGIAYSAARIEVTQNGALIYTTVVPSGPFTLVGLPLLSQSVDLEVTVHEEDGQQRRFIVPATQLRGGMTGRAAGYGLAVGQVRRYAGDERDAPSFAAASKDWRLGSRGQVTAGAMFGTGYESLGWAMQGGIGDRLILGGRQVISRAQYQAVSGTQLQWTASGRLSERLSTSVALTQQTQGFRTLSDTTWDSRNDRPFQRVRNQLTANLSTSSPVYGGFSASYSRFSLFDGTATSRVALAWSQSIRRANVTFTVERDVAGASDDARGTAAYLSVSLPLGARQTLRGYVRNDDVSGTRSGLRFNEQFSDTLAYSIGAERPDDGSAGFNGRVNLLPRYSQLDMGYSRSGADSQNYDIGLRGGALVHGGGVTLSPYPLRETFALLKAGDSAGVRLNTPRGPVWTDHSGHAVAASLPAYSKGRVELDTASLGRNVDVHNAFQEVEAGRGAFAHLAFDMVTARRVLLQARTADNVLLRKGGAVFDAQGQYITNVLEAGTIFLPDVRPDTSLHVVLPDGIRCRLVYSLGEPPDTQSLYETAQATCHAV
ncbi:MULTISPECIES: fimbria/pilus outer membrane usher protein [unclassified Pseudomonas]|uniref:fimbria/pilus outer membrane usher protein n=1 Tax=unclassified Pseudomonas TaxID=196821 RepID=UPI000A1DA717|nr:MULTISPECIES: fimbria/pilus outer membrane usher protein [unclassified Pseudomonas]MBX8470042.1 fimbria/pilus outer membrane usher protein [Pseudomonas sp. RIT778]